MDACPGVQCYHWEHILEELNGLENLAKHLTGIKIVMLLKWEVRLGFDICDDKWGFHDSMLFYLFINIHLGA